MDGSASPAAASRPRTVVATLVIELVRQQLAAWTAENRPLTGTPTDPRSDVHVIDLGGGTGSLATALVGVDEPYRVTVVDPSPDALAALGRRAADAGLTDRVTGVLGDASEAADLVGAGGADVVICHRVLEYVDDPAGTLAAIAKVLRPGGLLSLLVSQRSSVVLGHAVAGDLAAARAVLADPHRLDRTMIINLVTQEGLEPTAVHGIGAIASMVHEPVSARDDLLALERDVSSQADFQPLAPYLHVSARRR